MIVATECVMERPVSASDLKNALAKLLRIPQKRVYILHQPDLHWPRVGDCEFAVAELTQLNCNRQQLVSISANVDQCDGLGIPFVAAMAQDLGLACLLPGPSPCVLEYILVTPSGAAKPVAMNEAALDDDRYVICWNDNIRKDGETQYFVGDL